MAIEDNIITIIYSNFPLYNGSAHDSAALLEINVYSIPEWAHIQLQSLSTGQPN